MKTQKSEGEGRGWVGFFSCLDLIRIVFLMIERNGAAIDYARREAKGLPSIVSFFLSLFFFFFAFFSFFFSFFFRRDAHF